MNDITNINGIIVYVLTIITFALGFWYGYCDGRAAGVRSMRARFQDQHNKTHASGGE